MSHTKGPWTLPHFATEHGCPCSYIFAGDYLGGIAEVYADNGKSIADGGNDCPPLAEAKANAHLIAAAPDLLAALEHSLGCMSEARCEKCVAGANVAYRARGGK